MTLNALKPSMREKKRYICFKIKGADVSAEDAQKIILSRIKKWIGEKDFSLGRVFFQKKFYDSNKGIISCNHQQYPDVKVGITLVDEIKIKVFHVSGILKKAREKLAEYND